ncbi:hypothetical protein [Lapillicoccus sp.]|uniref:hypothetical protein n=1 Tax=Lapillicoccus sp. TaxID=1909287 RepID=UPI0027C985F9|nr:hypothetical protein [Actinomycetota bacterium]
MSSGIAGQGGAQALDVLVFCVPRESTDDVLAAVFQAGAGSIGDYEHCAFVADGVGQFRPIRDARPVIGQLGNLEHVPEHRVEVVLPRPLRAAVVAALLEAHPYDVPAYHVLETATLDRS